MEQSSQVFLSLAILVVAAARMAILKIDFKQALLEVAVLLSVVIGITRFVSQEALSGGFVKQGSELSDGIAPAQAVAAENPTGAENAKLYAAACVASDHTHSLWLGPGRPTLPLAKGDAWDHQEQFKGHHAHVRTVDH